MNIANFSLNINDIKLGEMIYLKSDKNALKQRDINVFLAPDNNYVIHCSVVMASVLLNCDSSSNINFYIADGGLSDENKNYLRSLNKIRDFNIYFPDVTKFDFSDFPLNRKHIKVSSTYYRLRICEILPEDVEKILYLDCDVIVEHDLKELFDIDMGENIVGVVEDESGISNSIRLGLDFYSNSGVILFNMKEIRKFNFYEKCVDYFYKNKALIKFQDQDILNGVLNNKCLKLPLNWNVSPLVFKDNDVWKQYTGIYDKIQAALEPKIIHYTYIPKPWQKKCTHPLKDEYLKYLQFANKDYYEKLKGNITNKRKLFSVVKNGTYYEVRIFGRLIKIRRKTDLNMIKDELHAVHYELSYIKQKLEKLK